MVVWVPGKYFNLLRESVWQPGTPNMHVESKLVVSDMKKWVLRQTSNRKSSLPKLNIKKKVVSTISGVSKQNLHFKHQVLVAPFEASKFKHSGDCTWRIIPVSKWLGSPPKNCRKAGAGVYIGYRVSAHLIHSHKFSTKKTFHAMFYVSTSFIFHVLYPKLFVVSYPINYVEL